MKWSFNYYRYDYMEGSVSLNEHKQFKYWQFLNHLPLTRYLRRIRLFFKLYGVRPCGYNISCIGKSGINWE
jgi:hypothetical protein